MKPRFVVCLYSLSVRRYEYSDEKVLQLQELYSGPLQNGFCPTGGRDQNNHKKSKDTEATHSRAKRENSHKTVFHFFFWGGEKTKQNIPVTLKKWVKVKNAHLCYTHERENKTKHSCDLEKMGHVKVKNAHLCYTHETHILSSGV